MSLKKSRTRVSKSDEEWQKQLSPQQYTVTRLHGTEPPFSHPYNAGKKTGTYRCICCGEALFTSGDKFDSGTGWPSFTAPASGDAVSKLEDNQLSMSRTEVRCAACDSHLGHVFPDGPQPTGLRYCINGVALKMDEEDSEAEK